MIWLVGFLIAAIVVFAYILMNSGDDGEYQQGYMDGYEDGQQENPMRGE